MRTGTCHWPLRRSSSAASSPSRSRRSCRGRDRPKRSSLLPDVPTSAEAGLPGFEAGLNYGLLAPAGTPKAIIDKLNVVLRAGIDTPEVRARIAADGGDPLPSSPEEYAADIAKESEKWGTLIRKLNLKVE